MERPDTILPSIFGDSGQCFICGKPADSLYCSDECRNADAVAVDLVPECACGPGQKHARQCSNRSSCSSRTGFYSDMNPDPNLLSPLLTVSHRRLSHHGARKSFSSNATTVSSRPLSPISPPMTAGEIPPISDSLLQKSPYGIYPSRSPRNPDIATGGLPTPPLFTLDGTLSPSLRPVLRYARRVYPTNSSPRHRPAHRRTPSGNLLQLTYPPSESAPTSIAPSPALLAKGDNRPPYQTLATVPWETSTVRSRQKNRRSLPLGVGGLASPTSNPSCQGTRSPVSEFAQDQQLAIDTTVTSPSLAPRRDSKHGLSASYITARLDAFQREREYELQHEKLAPDMTPASEFTSASSLVSEFILNHEPEESSSPVVAPATETHTRGRSTSRPRSRSRGRGRSPRRPSEVRMDDEIRHVGIRLHHTTFDSSSSRSRSRNRREPRMRSRAHGRFATLRARRASSPGRGRDLSSCTPHAVPSPPMTAMRGRRLTDFAERQDRAAAKILGLDDEERRGRL